MPPEARVALILAKYAMLRIVPLVIPSVLIDVPIPIEPIPRQQGHRPRVHQGAGRRVGYVFYLDPGPAPGMSVAYWGPEIRVGVPQPALNINMDAHTNVESLSFTFQRRQRRSLPDRVHPGADTKVPIPIPDPDVTPLSPPLGR